MGDRRCCCDQDCPTFSDSFNRPNSTDIGDKWEEVTGDWEIFDGTLTAHEPSIAKSLEPHGPCTLVVRVLIKNPRAGATLRVLVKYKDQDNYYFSQMAFQDELGGMILSLGKRVGGVETIFESTNDILDITRYWHTCYSPRFEFSTGIPTSNLWVTQCIDEACDRDTENVSGLAVVSQPGEGDPTGFDTWEYNWHFKQIYKCSYCDCHCIESDGRTIACLPEVLHVTVLNVIGCSGIDGWTVPMNQVYSSKTVWQSDWVRKCSTSPLWYFRLQCYSEGTYILTIQTDTADVFNPGERRIDLTRLSDYTCIPFLLRFETRGLFVVSNCAPQPSACCEDPSCGDGYDKPYIRFEVTL